MTIIAKSSLLAKMSLSPGIFLSNRGNVIIGARKIGSGCVIQGDITIGTNINSGEDLLPCIEDNVWIGPDCVIFGNLTIGNGATICENTVLSRSIPANCVVKGNPAKVIARDVDNSALRGNPFVASANILTDRFNTR
jgi:serine O-acetyltransferase